VDRFPHDAHREQRAFVRKALSVLRGCPLWRNPESDGMEYGALADRAWSVRADGSSQDHRGGPELDLKPPRLIDRHRSSGAARNQAGT